MTVNDSKYSDNNPSPTVITICSGKGGVGKSFLAANIATVLADNAKVLVWDTNLQFPNIHMILDVEPPIRLNEVYEERVNVSSAIFQVMTNLFVISAASGLYECEQSNNNQIMKVFEEIVNNSDYDYIILDTAAGFSQDILQCCIISDMIILTVTDEPTSMFDAYGLVKILKNRIDTKKIHLLINNVIDKEDADDINKKFNLVTQKFLKFEIDSLGFIPYERAIRQSILSREIFVKNMPESEAGIAISKISESLCKMKKSYHYAGLRG